MRKGSDSAKLEEMRAILHALQRIGPDLAGPRLQDHADVGVTGAISSGPISQSSLRREKPDGKPEHLRPGAGRGSATKRFAIAGGILLVLAGAVGGIVLLNKPAPQNRASDIAATVHAPHNAPATTVDRSEPVSRQAAALSPAAILDQAERLMASGDILSAREKLRKSAQTRDSSPEIALALARSYDPNFLRSVAHPNADPDVKQAEFWYRRWHEIAIKEGLVSDAVPLERILRSMR